MGLSVESGVQPAYPVFILFLNFAQSLAWLVKLVGDEPGRPLRHLNRSFHGPQARLLAVEAQRRPASAHLPSSRRQPGRRQGNAICHLNYPTLTLAIAPFAPAAGNLPPTGHGTPHDPGGQFFEVQNSANKFNVSRAHEPGPASPRELAHRHKGPRCCATLSLSAKKTTVLSVGAMP